MSALLKTKHSDCCNRLTDLLGKHSIGCKFIAGTKDIWCRDYMPVQNAKGQLVQFKYEPSYLKGKAEYEASRSDVRHVDTTNGLTPIFSNINLDGGNVVMLGNKAIITDRVFSENPEMSHDDLLNQLSELLECEVIIIPAYKPYLDFTGHADGMVRFVNKDTVLVNDLEQDFKYMRDAMIAALGKANLNYINFPFFNYKDPKHRDNAIGVYLNYLEVGDLIVMPVFGVPGNKDAEALAKLKEVFPNKTIETIDFNDVALDGGILNCTTWVINQ